MLYLEKMVTKKMTTITKEYIRCDCCLAERSQYACCDEWYYVHTHKQVHLCPKCMAWMRKLVQAMGWKISTCEPDYKYIVPVFINNFY